MIALSKFLLRFARCASGSALLEATIVIPLAISLMVGGVDFGLALNTQATGSKAVRDAARYLASVPRDYVCTWGRTNAQNLAVYGKLSPAQTDLPLVTGWTMNGGSNNFVNLGSATDCADPAAITVIQLEARIPYSSIMLSAILPGVAVLTLAANHEERHIGQ